MRLGTGIIIDVLTTMSFTVKGQKSTLTRRLVDGIYIVCVLGGLVLLLRKTDWQQLALIGPRLNWLALLMVLGLTITNVLLMIYRWYLLLRPIKPNISLRNVVKVSLNGLAVNFATPGKMGVPAKALLLKKTEQVEISTSLTSLFVELIYEYGTLGLFMLIAGAAGGYWAAIWKSLGADFITKTKFILAAIAIMALLVFLFRRKLAASRVVKNLQMAMRATLRRTDLLLWILAISAINLALTFWADWLLYKSLGFPAPYLFIVFAGALSNIVGFFSPLPGGLGLREVSNAYLYQSFFNIGQIALVATVIRRLITYGSLILLFGIEWLIGDTIRLAEIRETDVALVDKEKVL
jgi:uncharacterized membrane protein YbhN (UPF0104 family)